MNGWPDFIDHFLKNITIVENPASLKQAMIETLIDLTVKNQVKNLLLKTLKSGVREAWHSSPQVIVEIASIEIPMNGGPNLIDHFLKNITMVENPTSLKHATIETLAYVCQKVFPQNLEADQLNSVLSVVLRSMSFIDDTCDLRLAATRALCNALDCSLINFNDETERNHIMKALLKTSASKEAEFECLLSISSTCYYILSHNKCSVKSMPCSGTS